MINKYLSTGFRNDKTSLLFGHKFVQTPNFDTLTKSASPRYIRYSLGFDDSLIEFGTVSFSHEKRTKNVSVTYRLQTGRACSGV